MLFMLKLEKGCGIQEGLKDFRVNISNIASGITGMVFSISGIVVIFSNIAAKIGFKAPSARCLSTTAPEFEHHFHATKHQGLIIVLAQSNCDESNWRFCNDKLSRNFAVKQSPVQSANH